VFKKCSLIQIEYFELRFEEIGGERQEEIMASTFLARQRWVKVERPPFLKLIEMFPPLKELGTPVIFI